MPGNNILLINNTDRVAVLISNIYVQVGNRLGHVISSWRRPDSRYLTTRLYRQRRGFYTMSGCSWPHSDRVTSYYAQRHGGIVPLGNSIYRTEVEISEDTGLDSKTVIYIPRGF